MKKVGDIDSEYSVFGLCLDSTDKTWLHDGQTNQIISLDKDLKEKAVFGGISFNRKIVLLQNAVLQAPRHFFI